MKESEELPSIEDLSEDINRLHAKYTPVKKQEKPDGLRNAARMGVDLAAGSLVGSVMGFYLDKWLGTSPFLFILCFFLGSAGGFLTMLKSLKKYENENNKVD
ncbi:MAG: AtpZ/AtpI family protein [Pseudomonadota bacterium]